MHLAMRRSFPFLPRGLPSRPFCVTQCSLFAPSFSTSWRSSTLTEPYQYSRYYHDTVERRSRYRPGGCHPIRLGDTFHGRYHVHGKLGHGSHSTSWLARDKTKSKYVAVKVGMADSNNTEVEILSRLSRPIHGSNNRGRDMIIPILDHFNLDGPNGTHSCSVTAAARKSLALLAGYRRSRYPLPVVRSLAAQMVIAVAYIHNQGIVHGDIHLGNILLQLPNSLDNLSRKELYEKYDFPVSTSFVRDDQKEPAPGEPNQIYLPIFKDKAITLPESNILIADFGEAFCPAEEDRFESNTSFAYRPPEAYFEPKTPLSYPSDIWSLGCTIWEMSGSGRFLDGCYYPYEEEYNTRVQIDRLGPLPPEWLDGWERPADFCDDGEIVFEAPEEQTWDQRFQETIQDARRLMDVGAFDDDESQAFQEMLKAMIVFRPSERLTAEQVLNTRWMREYALPEWEKIEK